ncbi:MAG: carbohydrate ABC transporter permease [Cyanobacteriota bacterium]|nr:carbohydrate ABC transporter permease [Cyanobacteriota bacterium]
MLKRLLKFCLWRVGLYFILGLISLVMIGPLLWLLSTSLKSSGENIFAYPPQWLPQFPTLANFRQVWQNYPFFRYLLNSLGVAVITVIVNLWLSALAAYPLARFQFVGKSVFFWLMVGSLMIPFQITMIPLYILAVQLNLRNSYLGLIFPYAVSGFGIFLLRQAFLSIPRELEEAARMDGGSPWQIWQHIMLPGIQPDLITLAIFTFVGMWGDFLWPLLMLDEPQMFTLPLGVASLASAFASDWRLIAAGSILAILPVTVIFMVMQRYIIPNETSSGLQG